MADAHRSANLAQSLTLGILTNTWSFIFGDLFKLEILQSWLPCRHPKTQHSDADISDLGFILVMLLFLSEKIKTCWLYKNNVFANWESRAGGV